MIDALRLHADTTMDAVTLRVGDLDPRQAGLYHTAFLFDSPAALAATVYRTAQHSRSRFTGSADHLVSEAFYFTDPEGNGIELYTDRARDTWQHIGGELRMGAEPLDPNRYLHTHLTHEVLDAAATDPGSVGHVHLQVGDVPRAYDFYVDALGFDPTVQSYPGSLFASAGGYHHHVAMNTWQSAGAGPRAASLGLGEVAITVPARSDLDALAERLRDRGIDFGDDGRTLTTADPWGTRVSVALPGTSVDELLER